MTFTKEQKDRIRLGTYEQVRKIKKLTQKQQLEWLRKFFKYNEKGEPDIFSYGAFHSGITKDERTNYLRVRLNKWVIPKSILKRYEQSCGGDTCPVVTVNDQQVCLFYRHDVLRHSDFAIKNTETYFD